MTKANLQEALENIYASLNNDNEDIDRHLDHLKAAMKENGEKEISVNPTRLPQNNRQGRKMLQSYFKKRGVPVSFSE